MKWHVESWSPVDGRFFINAEEGTTVAEVMVTNPKIAAVIAAVLISTVKSKHFTPLPARTFFADNTHTLFR